MGILDKVKSSVQDVADSVSSAIDNEKVDAKFRDEKRTADKAYKEIGEAVVRAYIAGVPFDIATVSAQCDTAATAMKNITELNGQRTEPSNDYAPYLIDGDIPAAPAAALAVPAAEPEPAEEPPAQPVVEESVKEEPKDEPKDDDEYSDWVEVKDEVFWDEDETPAMEQTEAQPVQEAPVQTPQPVSNEQQSSDGDDSMLSRMQGYKSSNFDGDRIN